MPTPGHQATRLPLTLLLWVAVGSLVVGHAATKGRFYYNRHISACQNPALIRHRNDRRACDADCLNLPLPFDMATFLVRCIATLLNGAATWILLIAARKESIRGVRVWIAAQHRSEHALLRDRIAFALDLLERYDPVQFKRVHDDLSGIFVHHWPTTFGTIAQYQPALRLCNLNAGLLTSMPAGGSVVAACLIVHEVTHAALYRRGIPILCGNTSIRTRTERICIKAELAFAHRLPGAAPLQAALEQQLSAVDTTFSDDAYRLRLKLAIQTLTGRAPNPPDSPM